MTIKGLLVPLSYQENEAQCNVCLAKNALDAALATEFQALEKLECELIASSTQPDSQTASVYLRQFRDVLHEARTEYAVAFAVSLTLYHTVEKPRLHREARESVMAYQEYRERVSQALAMVDESFSSLCAQMQTKRWSTSIQTAAELLLQARAESVNSTDGFWSLVDKWAEDRHDKAWDFLDELTG